jgi:predicted TIM-barrel fold metal-dependent hydrolase
VEIAQRLGLVLLFHVTEPGLREYPGRRGLAFDDFREFVSRNRELDVVGAHVGGGYYANKHLRAAPYVDTAAQPFLHPGDESIEALKRIPGHRVLFGSDFPLISQARQLAELRAKLPRDCVEGALGENARELLGI